MALVSREVVNLVCSRLRSLLWRYKCRIKQKASYCVIAEKWLKRNYIVNDREREGEKSGEGEEGVK